MSENGNTSPAQAWARSRPVLDWLQERLRRLPWPVPWTTTAAAAAAGKVEFRRPSDHLLPQHVYLRGHGGRLLVDHVLSYETLADDFSLLMRCYKLPVPLGTALVNRPRDRVLSAGNLTAASLALLGRAFQEDYELLGYDLAESQVHTEQERSLYYDRPPRIRRVLDGCLAPVVDVHEKWHPLSRGFETGSARGVRPNHPNPRNHSNHP